MEVKIQLFFLSLSLLDHRGKISQACIERRNGGGGGRRGCPYMKVATGSGKFGVCLKQNYWLCLLQTHFFCKKMMSVLLLQLVRVTFDLSGHVLAYVCTDVFCGVFADFTSHKSKI